MTRSELESAAFWHDTLCLSCGYDSEDTFNECPECGSKHVADASEVLRFMEMVGENE